MPMMNIPDDRPYDLACLGRLAVDLYAQQFGARLEDVASFAKYLGGSSANIAFGAARLGLRTAMISRVGDEQMGRFLLETLQREGCDVSQVQVDPHRLTALALLGLKDRDTFPLIFYRENCADMALDAAQIDARFIAQCRALLVTGTHLSTPGVRAASVAALDYAQAHGVLRVLDIDYRPVLWGLTPRGDGENRFVANADVTRQLQGLLPRFDLLIGTEEEFLIAGGVPGDLLASLRAVRAITGAGLVVKLGPRGCCYIDGEVPGRLDEAMTVPGEAVEVLNVLGAGDAFAAGLLSGLLRHQDFSQAARIANACGAIVVSRHACAPAMPTQAELHHWFSGRCRANPGEDDTLSHLHRVSVKRPEWDALCVLAFDHRAQFFELARQAGADSARLPDLKKLLVRAAESVESSHRLQGRVGVLIDEKYGLDALASATGRGWWIGRPVEHPLSRPLVFDGTASLGSQLARWPREHTVKCLIYTHPDEAYGLRLAQESRLRELWEATRISGHELLLEVITPPSTLPVPGTVAARDAAILRTVKRFYNLGFKPEWWKLAPMAPAGWQALADLIQQHDPYCRGAVILGLNQPLADLAASFAQARNPIVKGFMVGRTLWAAPAAQWLAQEIDDDALIRGVAGNFAALTDAWFERHAAEVA
ncbi:bifunctional 5-dehydro-2-deoxygluconokinase/5-dehydro-2-deoxyphosphogluconate aldolase [Castellaniella hirudinis]|uniref:bifunctional 5-dehydro-2-deoxygluconokinase/5-dehydro-2- deoxyphosphogluconate aldolase n=1 Tax=Castellaniella hirudinis TaxID=1144617 RepID=UPI0039C42BCD